VSFDSSKEIDNEQFLYKLQEDDHDSDSDNEEDPSSLQSCTSANMISNNFSKKLSFDKTPTALATQSSVSPSPSSSSSSSAQVFKHQIRLPESDWRMRLGPEMGALSIHSTSVTGNNSSGSNTEENSTTSKVRLAHSRVSSTPITNHDSAAIEALTATMIGAWFLKFNRHGKNPKLRFFWVNPYSRLLNWAPVPTSLRKRGVTKTAFISSIVWTEPPENHKNYPPNEEHAITILTGDRSIVLVATTWHDHHTWVSGLTLLLSKSKDVKMPLHDRFKIMNFGSPRSQRSMRMSVNGGPRTPTDSSKTPSRGVSVAMKSSFSAESVLQGSPSSSKGTRLFHWSNHHHPNENQSQSFSSLNTSNSSNGGHGGESPESKKSVLLSEHHLNNENSVFHDGQKSDVIHSEVPLRSVSLGMGSKIVDESGGCEAPGSPIRTVKSITAGAASPKSVAGSHHRMKSFGLLRGLTFTPK
jgi:hypothetical protein